MKHIFIAISLLLSATATSFGQSEAGAFASLTTGYGFSEDWGGGLNSVEISSYSCNLKAGYRFNNNFEWSTGISYLKSGYQTNLEYANIDERYYTEYKFDQVMIPLQLGYSIRLSDKCRLNPAVNVAVSRLLKGHYFSQTDIFYDAKIPASTFNQTYNRTNFWVGTSLQFSYKLNDNFSLLGGYYFNSMVSDLNKIRVASENQQIFTVAAELGVRYHF